MLRSGVLIAPEKWGASALDRPYDGLSGRLGVEVIRDPAAIRPSSAMRWLDPIALPFFTFFLAALARQYGLPVPQLPLRGGSSPWHHQHHAPAQLALPQAPPAPEGVVQEEDFFHLPLQALKVGVADALAHQEVRRQLKIRYYDPMDSPLIDPVGQNWG